MINLTELHFKSVSPYNLFIKTLSSLSKNKINHINFSRYTVNNLVYEHINMPTKKEVKTYSKTSVTKENNVNHPIYDARHFMKKNIQYHQFPSLYQYDDECYIERQSVCLHVNIYLHYEKWSYDNDHKKDMLYLNIIHDAKVDDQVTQPIIDSVVNIITKHLDSTF